MNIPLLNEIMKMICVLLNEKLSNQKQCYDLSMELERNSRILDETTVISQKTEMKYKSMKARAVEAKECIDKQEKRYEELLSEFSVLNVSRDIAASFEMENISFSKDLYAEKSLREEEERKYLGEIEVLKNRLKNSTHCVETLAEYSVTLENRFKEVLIEKKILKTMYEGYYDLKSGVIDVSKECMRISGYPGVSGIPIISGYPGSPKSINDSKNNLLKKRKKSLRVVVIYLLAGLRLFKILFNIKFPKQLNSLVNKHEISTIFFLKKFEAFVWSDKIFNIVNQKKIFLSLLDLISYKRHYNGTKNNNFGIYNIFRNKGDFYAYIYLYCIFYIFVYGSICIYIHMIDIYFSM